MPTKLLILCSLLTASILADNEIFYGKLTKGDTTDLNALSPVRNQNQPHQCGVSWAFAITSSMADQFNALRSLEFPEVVLSPQMLLSCHSTEVNKTCAYSNSIENADIKRTLDNIIEFGVSRESCNNWSSNDKETCDAQAECKDCANGENINNKPNCFPRDFTSFKLKSYTDLSSTNGVRNDTEAIRAGVISALNEHGPVVCNIKHSKELFRWRVDEQDIYAETGSLVDYATWVSIVGYVASEKKTDRTATVENLWVVRLSFGDSVGYYGYIYLNADASNNDLGVLDNCFALEVDTKMTVKANSTRPNLGLFRSVLRSEYDITQPRFSRPQATPKATADSGLERAPSSGGALDTPIFWGNRNGRNYMTWIKNQHIPVYCGSCWAQSATSVISDRLNIMNIDNGRSFPRHVLSVQAVINCNLGGTCLGGGSGLVFERARYWKIPTDTCYVYVAQNPTQFGCEGSSRCYNASKDDTWPLSEFNGVTVEEWAVIRGPDQMKMALQDGPISCSFEVTDEFEKYKVTDGINVFSQSKMNFEINHAVSVVGWDRDDKGDYWIVRNSWGVEYGYNGMFYMRDGNVLGIESQCVAPTKITFRGWKN